MPLVLRVDVDKPYGRDSLAQKVLSRLCEYELLPGLPFLGYLNHLWTFLTYLNRENIPAHIYFRRCTLPCSDRGLLDGHMIGVHSEDTRSFESCKAEFDTIQSHFLPRKISSFSKHGSGVWKSGRMHYPAYEPQSYLQWASKLGVPFLYGNEETDACEESCGAGGYYPRMFWIDVVDESDEDETLLQPVVERAVNENVIVIIHPCNFVANKRVRKRLSMLTEMARKLNIEWTTLQEKVGK